MTSYPAQWEADVVLRDGGTAHLRPIVPEDADALQRFHKAQSPESIYLRFFAPMPELPPRELARFVTVDHTDRVAFVLLVGEDIIGVGRYDRLDAISAEVAFNIADAHQGRGIGSILLEHLAAAALENGITVFTAEVLPQNRSMLQVFAAAGYEVSREFDDGVVAVRFEIDPTDKSMQVVAAREHRAESLSVRQILHPRSVVVIGASRTRHSTGNLLVRNLSSAGFTGRLTIVHPEADSIAGLPTVRSLEDLTEPADLAVIAVPAEAVSGVVRDCASHGVKAVVVVSSGFAETGAEGTALQREVVATARMHGMRLVGPNSFGIANTAGDIALNASLSPFFPESGTLGLFSQSGALGTALLARATQLGLGISTFVSAGNRADLSGNDVLQYWEEDPATSAVGLYLESIGNPRKFSRIARRVSRVKPVVVVKSDLTGQELPPGHQVRLSGLEERASGALDEVLAQAGVIRAASTRQLFDVAQVLTSQPLPAGRRVGIVGNSAAVGTLLAQGARADGLEVPHAPVSLHPEVQADEFARALAEMFAREDVDSVIVSFTPSAGASEAEIAGALSELAATSDKTTVACFSGVQGVREELTAFVADADGRRISRSVPSYFGPEEAVWALARTVDYAMWRAEDHGRYPELEGIDRRCARGIVDEALASVPVGESVLLGAPETRALMSAYGIAPLPLITTHSVAEAREAAEQLGYPVAIKAVNKRLRHRMELGGVRLNIETPEELADDYAQVCELVAEYADDDGPTGIDVQQMAPPGIPCVVRAGEDPLLGPVVSFSLAGDTSELVGDIAHRVAPLTDVDASEMIRSVKSSPRLFGYKGLPVANVEPIEDLLLRVAELVDDIPAVADVEIHPVVATPAGAHVLSTRVILRESHDRIDSGRRRLA
ncbi:GNAT family N-acetyltransferase [Brevibacterium album]|uniref:bifunctional acetate--CoA ligase family protein/GNAT family N-acetyltransferase n=1 Tax=Brevibacterium album TaxID=417948 RepID=UPI0004171143|nr:GNAT family N-acetyltransferase [Brevibacterium album]